MKHFFVLTFDTDDDFEMNPDVKFTYYFKEYCFKRIKEIIEEASDVTCNFDSQRGYVKDWKNSCKMFLNQLKSTDPHYDDVFVGGNRTIHFKKVYIPSQFDD